MFLIKRIFDFGFDATACWPEDPTKRTGYGTHKIMCVRGFDNSYEAHDYALDQVIERHRKSDGKLPSFDEINYGGAYSHYTYRSLSDERLKQEISNATGAEVNQIQITRRF